MQNKGSQAEPGHRSTEGKPRSLGSARPKDCLHLVLDARGLPTGYGLELCIRATRTQGPIQLTQPK